MTHLKRVFSATALLGAALLAGSGLAVAQPQSSPSKSASCFRSSEWGHWIGANPHVMYIRVAVNRVYRLDFAASCPLITDPSSHLITRFQGGNLICSPIDIDLKVSNTNGFAEPCIVSGLRQLTPDEIAALPDSDRP